MRLEDFYLNVNADSQMQGIGFDADQCIVQETISGSNAIIALDSITNNEWPLLRDVILRFKNPEVLQTMSRVVGYYSRIANWNKSKKGELSDRQKGNYAIKSES